LGRRAGAPKMSEREPESRGRSARVSSRGDPSAKNLVEFAVGAAHYAVDIFRVREIVNPMVLVPMPHVPDFVLGLADHRGEVVPVVDLRRRFALGPAPATLRPQWLVVDGGDRHLGPLGDGVTEVFGLA